MLKTNPNDIYIEKSEYSDALHVSEGKDGFDYGFTRFRDGGRISNVWSLMGYENPRRIIINEDSRYQIMELLSDPNFFKDNLVGIGSETSIFGNEKDIDANRGLVSRHAYWLRANLDETGNIESYNTLNPWGITEGTFNRHEIFQHSQHIYIAGRKRGNNKKNVAQALPNNSRLGIPAEHSDGTAQGGRADVVERFILKNAQTIEVKEGDIVQEIGDAILIAHKKGGVTRVSKNNISEMKFKDTPID